MDKHEDIIKKRAERKVPKKTLVAVPPSFFHMQKQALDETGLIGSLLIPIDGVVKGIGLFVESVDSKTAVNYVLSLKDLDHETIKSFKTKKNFLYVKTDKVVQGGTILKMGCEEPEKVTGVHVTILFVVDIKEGLKGVV